jgi:cysteine desulfurase/selenocysteine lyase
MIPLVNTLTPVDKWRAHFPQLHKNVRGLPLVYLDNAATAQKPQCVIDEMNAYYESYCGNINRGAHHLSEMATAKFSEARAIVARFIGASTDEIVFTRGTTESINLVAHGLKHMHFQPGDEIILTGMEHHSNIVPWFMLAKEMGLDLKVAPVLDDGTLDLMAYARLFSKKTKLAAFTHASNALGSINPVKEMVGIAKSNGALTLIDGAQAVHHLSVDVKNLDVDFYAFSGHKAYGPTGVGVLFGKRELLNRMPPYQGGGDMITSVSFDEVLFAESPQKFEAGTPNIAGVIGLGRALQFISELGLSNLSRHEKALHDLTIEKLKTVPHVRVMGASPHKVSVISLVVDGVHPHDLATIFDREGIAIRAGHLCAQPLVKRFGQSSFARVSFGFYNTFAEVEKLIVAFYRAFEVFSL